MGQLRDRTTISIRIKDTPDDVYTAVYSFLHGTLWFGTVRGARPKARYGIVYVTVFETSIGKCGNNNGIWVGEITEIICTANSCCNTAILYCEIRRVF